MEETQRREEERISEESRAICDEFKIWRKNVPFLYDMLLSHALTWPSLTVQWFPEAIRNEETETTTQRLLLSTHTTNQEEEYLQIVTLTLPDTVGDASIRSFEDGGYGLGESKVRITQKIPMPHEVNRARYMPTNSNIIAVRYDAPEVCIYDYTKHSSFSKEASPNITLTGHTNGGYGLAWHPQTADALITAGHDGKVCLFSIGQSTTPTAQFKENEEINDISLSPETGLVAIAKDKNGTVVLDMRSGDRTLLDSGDTLCAQYSLEKDNILATGGKEGALHIWDVRNTGAPLHTFVGHTGDVLQVQWSPHFENVLASSGTDRRVNIWDISQIGQPQSEEDAEDGPPELLFVHGGHTDSVCDISWNPHEPWEIATVAEDNIFQVWQLSREVTPEEEMIEDTADPAMNNLINTPMKEEPAEDEMIGDEMTEESIE